jgi:hypothetical protein
MQGCRRACRTIAQPHALQIGQDCVKVISDFQTLLVTVPAATIAAGVRTFLQSIGRLPP